MVQQEQSQFRTIKLEACPQPCSAQLAEIKALTAACELMENEKADIYTDSAYVIYLGQFGNREASERATALPTDCRVDNRVNEAKGTGYHKVPGTQERK